jgi:UDP-glucose 4-epimerase
MGKILVTGGSGFIGSNLVRRLAREGAPVRVLDVRQPPTSVAEDDVEFLIGDIRERELCRRALKGMDAVVHLAAESGIPPSIEDPEGNFAVNVGGTLNLLLAAKEESVHRFIFASSGAVLGHHAPPGDESTQTRPVSPYGASKLAAEAYCLAFGSSYGISAAVMRFSNVYGPGSAHKQSVVAMFCRRALRGDPLVIFGDGGQTRDFLYVDDLTAGISLALEKPEASGVFQMASGVAVSVLEVAKAIGEFSLRDRGASVPIEFRPAREFEVRESFYRIDKARSALGFAPSADFRKGLERTWTWFLENGSSD